MPSPVPLISFLAFSLVWLQAFSQASAQMPSRGIYSDVTLPYLTYDETVGDVCVVLGRIGSNIGTPKIAYNTIAEMPFEAYVVM